MKKTNTATVPTRKEPAVALCIRLREEDLTAIRDAAMRDGDPVTVWCREAILEYIEKSAAGRAVPTLRFEMDGLGKSFSMRFRPSDHTRIAEAAAAVDRSVTAWARSVVVAYATRRAT